MSDEHSGLYWAAMDACHSVGLPWTDPRTGWTYHPPRCTCAPCKRRRTLKKKKKTSRGHQ